MTERWDCGFCTIEFNPDGSPVARLTVVSTKVKPTPDSFAEFTKIMRDILERKVVFNAVYDLRSYSLPSISQVKLLASFGAETGDYWDAYAVAQALLIMDNVWAVAAKATLKQFLKLCPPKNPMLITHSTEAAQQFFAACYEESRSHASSSQDTSFAQGRTASASSSKFLSSSTFASSDFHDPELVEMANGDTRVVQADESDRENSQPRIGGGPRDHSFVSVASMQNVPSFHRLKSLGSHKEIFFSMPELHEDAQKARVPFLKSRRQPFTLGDCCCFAFLKKPKPVPKPKTPKGNVKFADEQ